MRQTIPLINPQVVFSVLAGKNLVLEIFSFFCSAPCGDFFFRCVLNDTTTAHAAARTQNTHASTIGKPKGRAKKKKFGNRGADGRAVSKKRKPAQEHDFPSLGAGDAPFDGHDGSDLMDVDEEEGKAADEDANDEE